MKLIMESWRKFIEEYAAIKNRPALHIYPDPEMIINPAGQLDLEDAETLRNLLTEIKISKVLNAMKLWPTTQKNARFT